MPDTTRLYAQLDETDNELTDIHARARTLMDTIEGLIRAFAADHGCADKSVNYAVEYTADSLIDLIDDAAGPAYRRKVRLENEIGDIEAADERRSAPMVL
jgi:hypothetical protein